MKYFVADLHAGDKSIIKYRTQFPTLGYHDEFIMDLLSKLKPNDELEMVGDCIVGRHMLEEFRKIPCRKRLIVGNHDFEKGIRWNDLLGVVDDIQGGYRWKNHPYWITHIPVHAEHLRGRLNIHGHLHEIIIPDKRYINVSLEASGMRLVSHEEILDGGYRTYR